MRLWLNIDLPTSIATLHVSTCQYSVNKRVSTFKGVGDLRRDGGWLSFTSEDEAESYVRSYSDRRLSFKRCSRCI